jgi:hypothetical protein
MLVTLYTLTYKFKLPRLLRLIKADNLPVPDQVLEICQLEDQYIRLVRYLLKQMMPRMILLSSQHHLDVINYQPSMWCSEQKHPIRSSVKRCDRRVVVIHCLNCPNQTLLKFSQSTPLAIARHLHELE